MATVKTFRDGAAFRAWLEKNHDKVDELFIRYWKAATKKPGLRYKEALDEALCFGWIDGLVQPIDETCYAQRWTPRRKGSIWSKVNIAKVERLIAEGRMTPAGLAAFEKREKSGVYSFENRNTELSPAFAKKLAANKAASAYFKAQRPSYQRTAVHWVMSAKQEATREKRMAILLECSARQEWIPQFKPRAHLQRPGRASSSSSRSRSRSSSM
jgi:uncharacterized protein YdeI (YjbR/CyaY-like superfamily)